MGDKKKILLVDDEPFIARSLSFVLKKTGHQIDMAKNGVEAMEKVRASKPDLMFLDVMMPKMDGFQVCSEIKGDSSLKDIYIIMLTAKGQEKDKEKGLALGADEFTTKPFRPTLIVEMVNKILG